MSFLSARGDQLSRGLPYGTGAQLRAYNNQKNQKSKFQNTETPYKIGVFLFLNNFFE